MAATYGQRPSQILGITHEIAAYNIDMAVMYIGLKEQSKNGPDKQQMTNPAMLKQLVRQ